MNERVSTYLKRQTADQVHDLRTAARRLLVVMDLLPKNLRTKKSIQRYSDRVQKLISVNAKVRDLDIIISRAAGRKGDPEFAKLTKSIESERRSVLRPALEFASIFADSKQPSIRGKEVSTEDVRRRFDKIRKRLGSRISKRLPVVLEDASNKRELHRLREDSRMLRYTIELAGAGKSSKILEVLISRQEILGLIHDSDIVIDYLQHGEDSPEVRDLTRDEVTVRNKKYETFASMAGKTSTTPDR